MRIDDISLVHAEPRRLIVRLLSPGIQLLAVVLHGLDSIHESHTPGVIAAWWDTSAEIVNRFSCKGEPIAMFVDGNARICRHESGVSGDILDGTSSSGADGENLLSFARDTATCITNTFSEFLEDCMDTGTFIPCRGGSSVRCDYFMTNHLVVPLPASCKIWHELVLHGASDDHLPMVLRVSVATRPRVAVAKRRVVQYDRKAVAGAVSATCPSVIEKVRVLDGIIRSMPSVDMNVDPSSHAFVTERHIEDALISVFPRPAYPKRQDYISDDTLDLVARRGKIFKAFNATGRKVGRARVWFTFHTWKASVFEGGSVHSFRPVWRPARGPVSLKLCMKRVELSRVLAEVSEQAKQCIAVDFALFTAAKAEELVEASLLANTKSIHALLRQMRPWVPRQQFRLDIEPGVPATSYVEECNVVRCKFASLLHGQTMAYEDVVLAERRSASARACKHSDISLDLDAIPSVTQLTRRHAAVKALKGVGESRIGGEAHKLLPHAMAFVLHPLHTKVAVSLRRPLQWNGGQLMTLWKAKGARANIDNHRDITLADQDSKIFGAHLRGQLLPAAAAMACTTQMGSGMNGGATDTAHLFCTGTLALSMALKFSVAQIYLDVVCAFANLQRRISIPGDSSSEEQWRRHLGTCGFSAEEADAVVDLACSVLTWTAAGASAHNIALLEEAHLLTWFSVEGLRHVTVFCQGCAAGTPLADLLYVIAMARILNKMETCLESLGLIYYYDASGTADFFGEGVCELVHLGTRFDENRTPLRNVSYVDDVAVPIVASAQRIVSQTRAAMECILNVFRLFGMSLNSSLGKTNVTFRFAGNGAVAARQSLMINDGAVIACKMLDGSVFNLRAVESYKHLGAVTHPTLRLLPEISARMGSMQQALKPIAMKCFRAKGVSVTCKLQIARGLLFSRGLYCCGTWHLLALHEKQRVHSKVMYVYRSACSSHFKETTVPLTDLQIITEHGLLAPDTIVRLSRLCLAIRVACKAPQDLKRILFASMASPKSWLAAVNDDCCWIQS